MHWSFKECADHTVWKTFFSAAHHNAVHSLAALTPNPTLWQNQFFLSTFNELPVFTVFCCCFFYCSWHPLNPRFLQQNRTLGQPTFLAPAVRITLWQGITSSSNLTHTQRTTEDTQRGPVSLVDSPHCTALLGLVTVLVWCECTLTVSR